VTVLGAPTVTEVTEYLADSAGSWDEFVIQQALDAEQSDQLARVRLPTNSDGSQTYPPALKEALCRRVAHNLAARGNPLGVQATVTETTAINTYLPGSDAEVRRLEAPWRRRGTVA